MKKTFVITGASGFIGGALTKRLLEEGHIVYGVSRNLARLKKFELFDTFYGVECDLNEYSKLYEILTISDVDCVFHMAWEGVYGDSFKDFNLQLQNAASSCSLLLEAKKMNAKKFVFAGTHNEYEIENFLKNQKSFKPRYTCIYSSAKLTADLMGKTLAFQNNMNYSSGLVCMAYGEYNNSPMLANVLIQNLNKGISPKLIQGDNYYDMVYIDDIVNAFISIFEHGHSQQSYYIGHRNLMIFRDLITEIRNIINKDIPLRFGEFEDTINMDYSLIDLDALYRDTGFECQADFKESIIKTAEWLKKQEDF